ncbi:hypothetical protein [Pseudomonas mangiferae]|uniref:Uncharacterized protein n=1 Tax=Pseudomonas mangiferae TaxID=2593654 RepID=A0A553GUQ3_9PSED|nr:hypothetical protein [Pseudomonas mangiferae]TRX73250.1 hypothetical protein FM069_18935 [Pseudomonas mangiferae]
MSRWLDRQVSEYDPMMRLIATSEAAFKRHLGWMIKVFPPLFGFSIFLAYFNQYGFYPSFDLFQFSSLLLAAAVVGVVVIGAIVLLLFLPGAVIFQFFLEKPTIKDELRYARPYREEDRTPFAVTLLILPFFLPFMVLATLQLVVLLNDPSSYVTYIKFAPIGVGLLSGLLLQWRFGLPRFAFLNYGFAAYVPLMMVSLFTAYTLFDSASRFEEFLGGAAKWPLLIGVTLVLSGIAALCAATPIGGWSFALHTSVFFAMIIAFYSGTLTTLPEKTIQRLGLGHYTAERLVLDAQYCEAGTRQLLELDERCTLENVAVVWSLGETLVFQRAGHDKQLYQIPSRVVKAIVKAVK